jgi:glycolate oxidase FAD binding subunit
MLYGFANGGDVPVLAEAVRTRLAAANAAGGSAVLESAPAALRRQVDVWGPVRPEWRFAEAIKNAFDPSRILNRGRFVGGI